MDKKVNYVIRQDSPNGKILGTYNRKPNVPREIQNYVDSLKIGGNNEHLSRELGYMPIPNKAILIDQRSMTIVEKWNAPMFWAF